MEGEERSAPRAGWEDPGRFRPGLRELLVFAALVFVGFLVWFAVSPGITSRLFGVDLPRLPHVDSPLSLFRVAIVCGALALVSGFAFPTGFYLWGVALGLHGPLVEALTVYLMYQNGLGLVGGTRGIVGYVVISAMLFIFSILCYTSLSSVGAGVRYLSSPGARR